MEAMVEPIGDVIKDDSSRTPSRRFRPSLALAAFIMSLGVTGVTVFHGLRGAEIVVLPPQQILFYRDGDGERSVLAVLARVDVINKTSAYGDVLLGSEVQLEGPAGARFGGTALATPTFRSDGSAAAEADCPVISQCVRLAGLTVVEAVADVPDLPGGSGTSLPLVHALAGWNCEGSRSRCAGFDRFNDSVGQLKDRFSLSVRLRLHEDGVRTFRCNVSLNKAYLRQIGWVSVPCNLLPSNQ